MASESVSNFSPTMIVWFKLGHLGWRVWSLVFVFCFVFYFFVFVFKSILSWFGTHKVPQAGLKF